jgi:hypothetical protein
LQRNKNPNNILSLNGNALVEYCYNEMGEAIDRLKSGQSLEEIDTALPDLNNTTLDDE